MGEMRKAAQEVFSAGVEIQGAGRTDAGVHALGQVMHMKVTPRVRHAPEVIKRRLNDLLPADIAVLDVEPARRNFHARHDARARVYVYQISKRKQAFLKRYVWWIKEDLDLKRMQQAVSLLVGRHDFVCFRAADVSRPDESTIVEVKQAGIEIEEDIIQLRIEASHFLWRMMRRIIGALVKVGRGEISVQEFQGLIEGKCDPKWDVAAWTAPGIRFVSGTNPVLNVSESTQAPEAKGAKEQRGRGAKGGYSFIALCPLDPLILCPWFASAAS
jgi:tRNA pseudouridine38-40 synthase